MTLRKHFHEVVHADKNRLGLGCPEISNEDRFGQYLGFLDLRRHYTQSPIALALLAPPRHLREDPLTFIALGDYAPLFGAPSFPCTPFATHERAISGAVCAQSAAFIQLVALADRGARMFGPYTISMLATEETDERVTPVQGDLPIDCVRSRQPANAFERSFKIRGLTPGEIARVLRKCEVQGAEVRVKTADNLCDKLVTRLLDAYVRARYPVIVIVDSEEWYRDAASRGIISPEQYDSIKKNPEAHAINVFGIRYREDGDLQKAQVVVHDSANHPYEVRGMGDLLGAARRCSGRPSVSDLSATPTHPVRHVSLVVATGNGVDHQAMDAFELLRDGFPEFRKSFLRAYNDRWRISLCEAGMFDRRYRLPRGVKKILRDAVGLCPVWCFDFYKDAAQLASRMPDCTLLIRARADEGEDVFAGWIKWLEDGLIWIVSPGSRDEFVCTREEYCVR